MAGLNKVMLIGYLGRDPEMHYTPDGTPVTSFSLAVKRTWKSSDGKHRESVDWFNVVAWRQLAEACSEHLHKGECVYVEGRLQTRTWEDESGQHHFRTEIVANDMILLSHRPPTGEHEQAFAREEGETPSAATS